jgi:N-acetylglucosaminyl-diphospho-decaprenol L-rhamnosyltransferase
LSHVDVIIVNWNTGDRLRDCLASLERSRLTQVCIGHVIVIDNASHDGSASALQSQTLSLSLIRNRINRGFAVASNQGAAQSDAEYLLFLNPDTQLFDDTIEKSISFMADEQNCAVGVLGVQLLDGTGAVARSCARFPALSQYVTEALGLKYLSPTHFPGHFYLDWDHLQSRPIEQVMGAYMLVRRRVFETLCGFDERYFLYFEDVDFCLRAKRSGWATYYLATAQCMHVGGGSSNQVRARRLFYYWQSRLLFAFEYFDGARAWALVLLTLFLEPVSRMVHAIGKGSASGVAEVARGYVMLWQVLLRLLRGAHLRKTPVRA